MKFKDYASYLQLQHDEDPLYIFDEKVVLEDDNTIFLFFPFAILTSYHIFYIYFVQFGDAAPDLLKDYHVPHLFQEDLFDVLDEDKRPPFRWLIIGPERSGASWHVDPALTSAWNTLLCGRKRYGS